MTPVPVPGRVPTLATWVVPLHALVSIGLVLAGALVPGLPAWALPVSVLVAAVLFVAGVVVYIGHRDRWGERTIPDTVNYLSSQFAELKDLLMQTRTALPPDLAARVGALEAKLAEAAAPALQSPALEALARALEAKVTAEAAGSPPEPSSPPAATVSPPSAPEAPAAPPAVLSA